MAKPVILTADSTCDLGDELVSRHNVNLMPIHITYGETSYADGVDIRPDELYRRFEENGELPKTAAINMAEYSYFFKPFLDNGFEVVHISLGGALSSCHANAVMAAGQLEGVYPVDSCNLSTGSGLLVIEAAERIAAGMPAAQVAEEMRGLTGKVHASFVLEKLRFMAAGGRCSSVAAFGANLLQLKPCIMVDNTSGAMGVGKKYRGKMDKVLLEYVEDQIAQHENLDTRKAFITHSGVDEELIELVSQSLVEREIFDEIFITRAGCTVSSHCGPGTLGVLFMTV